eukprot:scaffold41487_cov100-Cyclotella_meneghiniana.AAC.2
MTIVDNELHVETALEPVARNRQHSHSPVNVNVKWTRILSPVPGYIDSGLNDKGSNALSVNFNFDSLRKEQELACLCIAP